MPQVKYTEEAIAQARTVVISVLTEAEKPLSMRQIIAESRGVHCDLSQKAVRDLKREEQVKFIWDKQDGRRPLYFLASLPIKY